MVPARAVGRIELAAPSWSEEEGASLPPVHSRVLLVDARLDLSLRLLGLSKWSLPPLAKGCYRETLFSGAKHTHQNTSVMTWGRECRYQKHPRSCFHIKVNPSYASVKSTTKTKCAYRSTATTNMHYASELGRDGTARASRWHRERGQSAWGG